MQTKVETNTQSILSLVFGLLTIMSFCVGIAPIPFTGPICFPFSFLFGVLALIFGIIAINQIRQRDESGSPLAWLGIIIGGSVFICVMCIFVTFAVLFIFAPNSMPVPPFWNGNQL